MIPRLSLVTRLLAAPLVAVSFVPVSFVAVPLVASLLSISTAPVPVQAMGQMAQQMPAGHVLTTPDKIVWGPAPPGLPPGGQAAVLDGDPTKEGPFSMRVKLPDGYKVPPHWHPSDENLLVLSGTLMVGMGETLDASKAQTLTAGTYAKMPKEMRHFAMTRGETIFQIYGAGPFGITYVNPADDPRTGMSKK